MLAVKFGFKVILKKKVNHQCTINHGQWTIKKTQKPKVINYLQTFLDFQNVVKLFLTCLKIYS